jgi:hypothetical protein
MAQECRFYIFHGLLTSASTDTIAVTVEASSDAGSDGEAAIAFTYRSCDAVGGDTWGALTTATATGFNLSTANDNLMWEITVDPINVVNGPTNKDGRWARVAVAAPSDTISASLQSAFAIIKPRYKQTTLLATTGSS